MAELSTKYVEALEFAADAHRDQKRKSTAIPYFSHLIAVSSLVLEAGGTEDQAIAALLHDLIEDQHERFGGPEKAAQEIERRFGPAVRAMVQACTKKEEGLTSAQSKEAYVRRVPEMDAEGALISLADKLHNARAIVADGRRVGAAVFDRFNVTKQQTLDYYAGLARAFSRRKNTAPAQVMAEELGRVVEDMHRLAGK